MGTTVWPSLKAKTLISLPDRYSSMITRSPAAPKALSSIIWARASRALRDGLGDDDPLPRRQPVGFDHDRALSVAGDIPLPFYSRRSWRFWRRGCYISASAPWRRPCSTLSRWLVWWRRKSAAPGLGSGRRCRSARGASGPTTVRSYSLFAGGFNQRIDIGGFDVEVMGNLSRARVARGDVDFLNFGALSQLPDQGVLPGSPADNQYLYLPHPPLVPLPVFSPEPYISLL